MITYYDELPQEEQQELTEVIKLLYRQTFILERKYDKRSNRIKGNRDFRVCDKHLEFIREYFKVSGISVLENSSLGVFYIQGETLLGDKLPKLATLYILLLKLIYDEQMVISSSSSNIYTTLGEMNERLGGYRLLKNKPSVSDIKRAVTLLKKYQLIELFDMMEELESSSKIMIYPCINVVLLGDDVRAMLQNLSEGDDIDDESEL